MRYAFHKVLKPLQLIEPTAHDWAEIDQEMLNAYTTDFEELGFFKLIDFTVPPRGGITRLLINPQLQCGGQICQADTLPMFCLVFCVLEDDWALTLNNHSVDYDLDNIVSSIMQHPKHLYKSLKHASVEQLLQNFLDYRQQTIMDLAVQPITISTAAEFFSIANRRRSQQRRFLFRKSLAWSLLAMLILYFGHPKRMTTDK
jgi:hypothetical protein